MQDNSARIIVADCVKYLKTLSENSLDSCVCDPPYGLEFMGKEWDRLWGGKQEDNPDGFTGSDGVRRSKTNPVSAILGRPPVYEAGTAAQAWHLRWATEVFRVLKPGGHLLAFGGTRTYHRLACAVEDAGFEIRDTIDWVYSTGFPKSHDVSKAIDRLLGTENDRPVVGPNPANRQGNFGTGVAGQTKTTDGGWRTPLRPDKTGPASEEAASVHGFGTALKPAHEPILVARKPLIGTVAENVLKHGTGALNVDATRVGLAGEENPSVSRRKGSISSLNSASNLFRSDGGWSLEEYQRERPSEALGRWPPNLVLTHSPGCRPTGPKIIRASSFYPDYEAGESTEKTDAIYGGGKGLRDGLEYQKSGSRPEVETVESWSCAVGCPVAEMDRQSGDRPVSGSAKNGRPALGNDYGAGNAVFPPGLGNRQGVLHNDEGGASRFFPTFSWHTDEVSFIYEPKASRSEREAGLDSEIEGETGLSYKTSGYRCRKCGKWKVSGNPCTCPEPDFEPQSFARPNVANNHPTVKPIALLRWLTRLVTPKGGTVLDPFAGSGSEGCAAVIEGFSYIGIEKEPKYADIARKRITYWESVPASKAPGNLLTTKTPSITLDAFETDRPI